MSVNFGRAALGGFVGTLVMTASRNPRDARAVSRSTNRTMAASDSKPRAGVEDRGIARAASPGAQRPRRQVRTAVRGPVNRPGPCR